MNADLNRDDALHTEALNRFQTLQTRVRQLGLREPDAVTLATVDAQGTPHARVVLLRLVDDRGFAFFTNSQSHKGEQLAHHPHAAICAYWDGLGEQVRVTGRVEVVSDAESDAYWQSRARESQLGAWASLQSQPLASRDELDLRLADFQQRFAGMEVPRPDHWHGYRVVPDRFEFWTNRPSRLHDRILYTRQASGWTRQLLYP